MSRSSTPFVAAPTAVLGITLALTYTSTARAAGTGMLYVKSEPAGATVFVDGEDRDRTPVLVKNLEPGKHTVEIKFPGAATHGETVVIEGGKVAKLHVKLDLPKASLTVITQPLEAQVHVDREARGSSPLTIEDLEPGPHEVIVIFDGNVRKAWKVVLKPGEARVLEIAEGSRAQAAEEAQETPDDRHDRTLDNVLDKFLEHVGKGAYDEAWKCLNTKSVGGELKAQADILRGAEGVLNALRARRKAIRKGAEALVGKDVQLETSGGKRSGKVKQVFDEGIDMVAKISLRGRVMGETKFAVEWDALTHSQEETLAGDWAKDAHGNVARAALALARGDHAAALAAVEEAGDQALAALLKARAEAMKPEPQAATRPEKEPPPPSRRAYVFTMKGLKTWEPSEVHVKRGQVVAISAPEDRTGRGTRDKNGIVAPTGALIMKVGNRVYHIGKGRTVKIVEDDMLYFRSNYHVTRNNTDVTISIVVAAGRRAEATSSQLTRGLVGWWKFDEGRGVVARDSSGNGQHARIHGGRWSEGCIGGGMYLDGKSAWVEVPDFGVTDDFTISLWLKPMSTRNGQCFVGVYTAGGRNVLLFGRWGDGYHVNLRNKGKETRPGQVTLGWQHLAIVGRRIANNSTEVFVCRDGRVLWSNTFATTVGNVTGTGLSIGQDWDEQRRTDFTHGTVDDVRIYNRALSAEEVRALAEGGGF